MSNTAIWFDIPAGRYELQGKSHDDTEFGPVMNGYEFSEQNHSIHLRLVVLDEADDWYAKRTNGLTAPDGEIFEQLKLF
jgi:hypothetical protein